VWTTKSRPLLGVQTTTALAAKAVGSQHCNYVTLTLFFRENLLPASFLRHSGRVAVGTAGVEISLDKEDFHIVMVDDDIDDIFLVKRGLEGTSAETCFSEFHSGADFFTFLETAGRPPDLVLLDINMPLMTGFEVLLRLQAHSAWAQIPVIVLSTSLYLSDRDKCLRLGAVDFVPKISVGTYIDTWIRRSTDSPVEKTKSASSVATSQGN